MNIKVGNQVKFIVAVKDVNGAAVTDLSTATNVLFMIKKYITDPDSEAVVSKSLGSGITVDDPVTGSISILINSPDTVSLEPGTYYMGLEIVYSTDNRQEVYLQENNSTINQISLTSDVIRNV